MLLVPPRHHRATSASRGDDGFTMIELVVSLGLIAAILTSASMLSGGAMRSYAGARMRSTFVELATGELELLRSSTYDRVGVAASDPDLATAYPAGEFEGRPVVLVPNASKPAVSRVTSSTVRGIRLPYTVRRWVTWTDPTAGPEVKFKKLTLQIEWLEASQQRTYRLATVLYPGGQSTGNASPTAVAAASATEVDVGTLISFSSVGSSDPEGAALTYTWAFGDGTGSNAASPTKSYAASGTYIARLVVTDPAGNADARTLTIIVRGVNSPPTASFVMSTSSGETPLTVGFDASASSDPTGGALSYTWSWGDGTADGSGVGASHTYSASGTYVVQLTVRNSFGSGATASQNVTATTLRCSILAARFRNPPSATDSTSNQIVVDGKHKPVNRDIRFTVTTNGACTTVTSRMTLESGSLVVTLIKETEVNGVRTWRKTVSFDPQDRVPTGCGQTAAASAEGTGSDAESYTYAVFKSGSSCP